MARILSNSVTLQAAIESSPGVLPGSPVWTLLEPNTISKFGAAIKVVSRDPISKLRQQRYGTVSDLDSDVDFEGDITQSHLDTFLEGFFFATAKNADCRFVGAAVTVSGYTITAATASQAAKFQWTSGGPISLVYARGYVNAANNGLHALTSDLALSGTAIPVTSLTVETPPTNAEVELCGIRCTAGDLALSVAAAVAGVSPNIGTLTAGNNSVSGGSEVDFTTLGINVGQFIHIGGLLAANQFAGSGSVKSFGYARIKAISAHSLTLDKMSATLIASDGTSTGSGGSLIPVDILFGRFIRNVPIDNADYMERTFQIEATWPNLGVAGSGSTTQYSYSVGNYCDQIQMKLPVANKGTIQFTFKGLDTPPPTQTRATNAATPIVPERVIAMNTTSDIARLRVTQVDESGLTTDFADLNITIANKAAPEKVLGKLGAKYMNFGNFMITVSATVIFTNDLVISAIRNNQLLSMDFIVRNTDGAMIMDMASFTLGGGDVNIVKDQSVQLKLTGTSVMDNLLQTSLSSSLFPVVPSISA